MKLNRLFAASVILFVGLLLSSCSSILSPFAKTKESPTLYPIMQNGKFGYINAKGEIVIQPQFAQSWFFSDGLAVACLDWGKCGYIDETGKFAINPQFQFATRFSEGLAAVQLGDKMGFIDKTGKFVINPQFEASGILMGAFSSFSEGFALINIGGKYGFIDRMGKIAINPQFESAMPFFEGLTAVRMGGKWGFADKEGKIVINPQFESATPFVNGLAAIQMGKQWGYIDKTGKIIINPQFDFAAPFSSEGIALVFLTGKAGYIDKQGKYLVNPQFSVPGNIRGEDLVFWALTITNDLSRLSFSEGLALANIGDSSQFEKTNFGYVDKSGKITINPQFKLAFPFYGDLALVMFDREEFGWIDREGKIVWRTIKENVQTPSKRDQIDVKVNAPSNTNMGVGNVNSSASVASSNINSAPQSNYSNEKTGRLATDLNLRSEPNKDAASLGIHFRNAKVKILDETSYERDGEISTWYKIRVTEYGCSAKPELGCGKNSPNDADEGWMNAKHILID